MPEGEGGGGVEGFAAEVPGGLFDFDVAAAFGEAGDFVDTVEADGAEDEDHWDGLWQR